MLSLDRLYAEETPESIENSFDVECQESLETKISPCLYRSLYAIIIDQDSGRCRALTSRPAKD